MPVIADGLKYWTERWHDVDLHVLEVDLLKRDVRPIPVGPNYPVQPYYTKDGTTRPAQLAQDAGALAAVGSDFTATRYDGVPLVGQPVGPFALDGEVWTTGQRPNPHLVLGLDSVGERTAYITSYPVSVNVNGVDVTEVNTRRGETPFRLYTPRGGTNVAPRGKRWHTVLHLHSNWVGATAYGAPVVWPTTWVLETDGEPTVQPAILDSFVVGEDLKVWTHCVRPQSLRHVISGVPQIIRAGVNVVPTLHLIAQAVAGPDNWFVRKNPRTAVGVSSSNQTLWLVTNVGRKPTSRGLRLKELGTFMLKLGAWDALNLDGGGSSFMWTQAGGLVMDSCYGDGTIAGTRPQGYATAVF